MIAPILAAALAAVAGASLRTEGKVLQATSARAYLDAGSDDGLAPGLELVFHRAGAEVGRCRLEAVSLHSAACGATGLRPGDAFALPGLADVPVRDAPRPPPAVAGADALRAQAAVLEAAPVELVVFKPSARPPGERRDAGASVELSEVAWVATGTTPYAGTRAAVALRSADVGLGMRLDVDAMAIRWTARPSAPAPRFRPSDASQLYVWQASLTRDASADGLIVSAGRILPWRIPGATILDGATAGWRGERWEAGGFAGFVPQPSTLALTTDRSTGGGYWSWDLPVGKEAVLRDEGRVAVVRSPELGTRLEVETLAAARFWRALDLAGSMRLGFGGDVQAPGNVDAARLELGGRPAEHWRVAGWLAYDGLDVPVTAEPAILPGHSRRAEGSVSWEEPNVRVTALGGVAKELGTSLDRGWVGPVVDLPRVFARRGGLSIGYLEELGWSDGRSAWLQGTFRPVERLRLLARLTWSHASALAVMQDEVSATLGLAADLGRIFSARLTATGRAPIPTGGGGEQPGGGTFLATVAARY